jgi:hypothetical protein
MLAEANWNRQLIGPATFLLVTLTLAAAQALAAGRWIAISAIASAALTVIWLPFFDVWYIPGHIRGLFNGAAEMTTVLRVIATYGLATGWALRQLLAQPAAPPSM